MNFSISSDCLCIVLSYFPAQRMVQFRQINQQWNQCSQLPLSWNKQNRLSVNYFQNQFYINHLLLKNFEMKDLVQFKHCKSLRILVNQEGKDVDSFNQVDQRISQNNNIYYSNIVSFRNLTCLELITSISSIVVHNVLSIAGKYYGDQLEILKLGRQTNIISLESLQLMIKPLHLFTSLIELELCYFWFLFCDIDYNIQYLAELPLSKTINRLSLDHCFKLDNNDMYNAHSNNENLLHLLKFKQLSNLSICDVGRRILTKVEETRLYCIAQELISGLPNLQMLPFHGNIHNNNKCTPSKNLKRLYSKDIQDITKYNTTEFPHVVELIINKIEFISTVVEFDKQLNKLELTHISLECVILWQQMLFHCSQGLTELRLFSITFNFPNSLKYLKHCCTLQHLEIAHCQRVNDSDLLDLIQHYPSHLYRLSLLYNPKISNVTINNLANASDKICLTSLILYSFKNNQNFDIESFQRLLLQNVRLVNLTINLPYRNFTLPLDLQIQLRNYYNTIVKRDLNLPACEIVCDLF